jgi:hypothetical protein
VTLSVPTFASDKIAIDARGMGVKYNLRLTKKQTVKETVVRRVRRQGETSFWALREVSFTVRQGESLGVIGPNGAGKSTLLQVLAGIITPSEGDVAVDGHISSLLTLGVGFDQELSGTDNIRLAGAFMGLDHRLVESKLPAIVAYADLGDFIDAPIKTYSSGMRARLVPREVEGARRRARAGGQGHRARDPRHELGHRVLQPGDADREGPHRHGGLPRGRRRPPPGALRGTPGRAARGRRLLGREGRAGQGRPQALSRVPAGPRTGTRSGICPVAVAAGPA